MIGANSLIDNVGSKTPTRENVRKKPTRVDLPALLPNKLLAAEPVIQPPELLLPVSSPIIKKKAKLSEKQEGSRDIKRGDTIIRILQTQQSSLPPKSSSASKSVREKWLLGERGFLGAASVPRRKSTGGFARR